MDLPDLKKIGARTAGDVATFCLCGGLAGFAEGHWNFLEFASTIEVAGFGALIGFGLKKLVESFLLFRKF